MAIFPDDSRAYDIVRQPTMYQNPIDSQVTAYGD